MRRSRILRTCAHCGVDISHYDPRARTCSARCRKIVSRRRTSVHKAIHQISDGLQTLGILVRSVPDLEDEVFHVLMLFENGMRNIRKLPPHKDTLELLNLRYRSQKNVTTVTDDSSSV